MRSLAVLHLTYSVVVAHAYDFLLFDFDILHAVNKRPADSSAISGINETVLGTRIERIFSVNKLRMQHHITLLRAGLHVRQPLPVDKIPRPCHTGGGSCRRQVSR